MPPQSRHVLVATLILASAAGGCSFALVNGPPPEHRQLSFFGCTSSNTIPTLDLAVGALSVVDAVVAGSGGGPSNSTTGSNKGDAITFAATAALLGASAAYGYKKTAECRTAEAELVRRTPPAPVLAPQPYLRPPVPYDPWLPHPAATPAPAPAALGPGAASPAPPPPARGSAWDGENPAP
ncbi:MAG TPA: hypothetical protein VGP64_08960 [Polyangia bacterium]|jgi:hypothetical protein